jgi:hypothetical protein
MKLDDFRTRYIVTEHLAQVDPTSPMERSLVKIPGMGVVHIDALKKNLAEKMADLAKRVASGDPDEIITAHKLMNGPAFNAMFDALVNGYEDLRKKGKK